MYSYDRSPPVGSIAAWESEGDEDTTDYYIVCDNHTFGFYIEGYLRRTVDCDSEEGKWLMLIFGLRAPEPRLKYELAKEPTVMEMFL